MPWPTPIDANISLIQPGQIEAAIQLFRAQLLEHGITTSPTPIRSVIEKVAADEKRGFILVAMIEDGTLVGAAFGSAFLGVEHGGESGWLEELYVRPEWRERGIGTRLVAEVIRMAKERGWRALDLEVEAGRRRVISLYERYGFQSQSRARFCLKLE
jgi:ribosomal protein S18 acetylase RimI-like enzyme